MSNIYSLPELTFKIAHITEEQMVISAHSTLSMPDSTAATRKAQVFTAHI